MKAINSNSIQFYFKLQIDQIPLLIYLSWLWAQRLHRKLIYILINPETVVHKQSNQIQILKDPTAPSPLPIQLHLQFTLQPPQLILTTPIHSPQPLQQTLIPFFVFFFFLPKSWKRTFPTLCHNDTFMWWSLIYITMTFLMQIGLYMLSWLWQSQMGS